MPFWVFFNFLASPLVISIHPPSPYIQWDTCIVCSKIRKEKEKLGACCSLINESKTVKNIFQVTGRHRPSQLVLAEHHSTAFLSAMVAVATVIDMIGGTQLSVVSISYFRWLAHSGIQCLKFFYVRNCDCSFRKKNPKNMWVYYKVPNKSKT